MPALHIDRASPPPHNDTASFDCRGAWVRSKTDTGLTVISISGEIDASNADDVSRHASALGSGCGALIIDLADVDFIALHGLRALFALRMQCARTNTTFVLIASHAVNRLLRWGDRDKLLPVVGSATEALQLIRGSDQGRRSLQLVTPTE